MPKRRCSWTQDGDDLPKRLKTGHCRLENLSDELLLRILSLLPVHELASCQSLSRRMRNMAGDAELWKQAYFEHFVQPRLARVCRYKRRQHRSLSIRRFNPKNWVDDEDLVRHGSRRDWKHRFKIRYRWSKGLCDLDEIPVAESPPIPRVLARMSHGVIHTIDSDHGLRAWSYRNPRKMLASQALTIDPQISLPRKPTALAVEQSSKMPHVQYIVTGFEDGSLQCNTFDRDSDSYALTHSGSASANGSLMGLALSDTHLATLHRNQTLAFYEHKQPTLGAPVGKQPLVPRLLTTLRSRSIHFPLSMSIRKAPSAAVVALAYSSPTLVSGWSPALQELHFTRDGVLQDSRLAFPPPDLSDTLTRGAQSRISAADDTENSRDAARPSSICYSHPYLLTTHADNTLTLSMVMSTEEGVKMSRKTRLWGHTSSVCGAQVESRGRAVSVSSRGEEIRIWQLEGAALPNNRGLFELEQSSILLTPEKKQYSSSADQQIVTRPRPREVEPPFQHRGCAKEAITRGWVGFDEENVVVLKEHLPGDQLLAVYDFS
ncbi:MAG: hypothetical protein Q9162_000996 [Coniocarpon cinnabarinum]